MSSDSDSKASEFPCAYFCIGVSVYILFVDLLLHLNFTLHLFLHTPHLSPCNGSEIIPYTDN